jgi:hypothetical protein
MKPLAPPSFRDRLAEILSTPDNPHQVYLTPHYAIEELLRREKWDKTHTFLEPAAGDGRIVTAFADAGYNIVGIDIRTEDIGGNVEGGVDFLQTTDRFNYVIGNPPYSKLEDRQLREDDPAPLMDQFVEHAKLIATHKVAMLLPLDFLVGCNRFNRGLLADPDFPLARIYPFVARLQFDHRRNCSFPTAWFVWERGGQPLFEWIDNQDND